MWLVGCGLGFFFSFLLLEKKKKNNIFLCIYVLLLAVRTASPDILNITGKKKVQKRDETAFLTLESVSSVESKKCKRVKKKKKVLY